MREKKKMRTKSEASAPPEANTPSATPAPTSPDAPSPVSPAAVSDAPPATTNDPDGKERKDRLAEERKLDDERQRASRVAHLAEAIFVISHAHIGTPASPPDAIKQAEKFEDEIDKRFPNLRR